MCTILLRVPGVTVQGAIPNRAPKSMKSANTDNQLEIIVSKLDPQEMRLPYENERASRQKKGNHIGDHLKTINSKRNHPYDKTLLNDHEQNKPKKTTDIENHLEVTLSKRQLPDMTARDEDNNFNEIKHVRMDSKMHKVDVGDNGKPQQIQISMKVAFDEHASEQIRLLTRAMEELNEGITAQIDQTTEGVVDFKPTSRSYGYLRNKRSVAKTAPSENKFTNVTATEETVDNQTKIIDSGNGTECNSTSGCRRSFNSDLQVSSAIKIRLLSYIHEYFNDITKKINSLKNVKNAFATDDEYNIGYMIANIDMLEVNLRNLKVEMEINKHQMGEKQILDLFDKVKVSNGVVSSLLIALKSIVDRHTEHHQYNANQYQVNK